MKMFKMKYKTPEGKQEVEIIEAADIDQARELALTLCQVRKYSFLSISTVLK